MQTEQISLNGYTVKIAHDECPENPFEVWDCEPPLLAYYDAGRHGFKAYNDAPKTWREILWLLPDSVFERKNRVAFLRRFLPSISSREYVQALRDNDGSDFEAFIQLFGDVYEEKPHGWSGAIEWLKTAASILEYGGITCHFTQSNGYSQGDSTLLLAIGLPSWVDKVGAPIESVPAQLESACDIHGFWQWGNVYGVASIEDDNGAEIPHGACWGFYGSDHERSGLLDNARNAIECHERAQEKEASSLSSALCSLE